MAYDLLLRRQTLANWARRASQPLPAPSLPATPPRTPFPNALPAKHKIGISCGVGRSPRTVKGEIMNGRRASIMGGIGASDDPLAQLPAKERKTVAQLIVLRKKADAGDVSAQRIVEAVAKLQIFMPPEPRYAEPAKL